MENRIREFRTRKGLSQRQLADKVGTSQQQIQRIESGSQAAVPVELGVRICAALEARLDQVFPETKSPLVKVAWARSEHSYTLEDFEKETEGADEMPGRMWVLKYLLRGGATGTLVLTGEEYSRVFRAVQRVDFFERFVVFDSETARVALNLDHLVFCQFLLEPYLEEQTIEIASDALVAYTSATAEPLPFDVSPDEVDLGEQPEAEEGVQLQHFFYMLECSHEPNEVLSFLDEDDERAFFRAADLAMVVAPLWAVKPSVSERGI